MACARTTLLEDDDDDVMSSLPLVALPNSQSLKTHTHYASRTHALGRIDVVSDIGGRQHGCDALVAWQREQLLDAGQPRVLTRRSAHTFHAPTAHQAHTHTHTRTSRSKTSSKRRMASSRSRCLNLIATIPYKHECTCVT
jgi:hypothetical protein